MRFESDNSTIPNKHSTVKYCYFNDFAAVDRFFRDILMFVRRETLLLV